MNLKSTGQAKNRIVTITGFSRTGNPLGFRRLQPFLPELPDMLEGHEELTLSEEMSEELGRMSASTVDRLLKPYRHRGQRRPFSATKPAAPDASGAAIPIQAFADWDD